MAHVPDVMAAAHNSARAAASRGPQQSTNEVLMVAPTAFGFNEEAAQDNSFMHSAASPEQGSDVTRTVLQEYAGLYRELSEARIFQLVVTAVASCFGDPFALWSFCWSSRGSAMIAFRRQK